LFGAEGSVAAEIELQIMMVASGIAVAGILLVSPIVSQLGGTFGVSGAKAGQLITVFTAPPILVTPVAGVLADRYGRKRVLVAGLATFGAAGSAITLTADFTQVLVLRALQGGGFGAIMPITATYVGDLYDGIREATAQGLRAASIQGVSLVSPVLAGVLVLVSWQVPFALYLLALGVAVWAWTALPTVIPNETRTLSDYIASLRATLVDPVLAVTLFSIVIRFAAVTGFFAYISVRLEAGMDASSVASGAIVSLFGLFALILSAQVGRLTTAHNALAMMIVGFLTTGVGLVFIGLASTYAGIVAGVILLGIGGGITAPVQKSLVTQLVPATLRAGAVSSANLGQSLGQTVGPLLIGLLLLRYTPGTTFAIVGLGTAVVGCGLFIVAYRRDPMAGEFSTRA